MNTEELWTTFRADPRPVLALLKWVTAQPDPFGALATLVGALPPDEAAALMPAIRLEQSRRRVWLRKAKPDAA